MYVFKIIIFLLYRDIWNRFLEFESNIGDLSSILKVEKRRSAVLGKVFKKKINLVLALTCLSDLCYYNILSLISFIFQNTC